MKPATRSKLRRAWNQWKPALMALALFALVAIIASACAPPVPMHHVVVESVTVVTVPMEGGAMMSKSEKTTISGDEPKETK